VSWVDLRALAVWPGVRQQASPRPEPGADAEPTAPDGIMTAYPIPGMMLADLGLTVCAPTATRTRDLLLRSSLHGQP
jgi:hypothetical protein